MTPAHSPIPSDERHPSPDGGAVVEVRLHPWHPHEPPDPLPRLVEAASGRVLLDLWPLCRSIDWRFDPDGTFVARVGGFVIAVPPSRDVCRLNYDDWAPRPLEGAGERLARLLAEKRLDDAPDGSLRIVSDIHVHREHGRDWHFARPLVVDRRSDAVLLDLRGRNVDLLHVFWAPDGQARLSLAPPDAIRFAIDPDGRTFREAPGVRDPYREPPAETPLGPPRPIEALQAAAERRLGAGYDAPGALPAPQPSSIPMAGAGSRRAVLIGAIIVIGAALIALVLFLYGR